MSVNYDGFVSTILKDDSILNPTPEPTITGFSFLQPFFSGKGLDNTIQRFTGVGAFDREYGQDLRNVKLYGHGGLLARKIVRSGGKLDACRLMPENAASASILVGIAINDAEETVTIYQKDEYGNFILDGSGNKIPEDDGSGNDLTMPAKKVKVVSKVYDPLVSQAVNYNPYPLIEDDGLGNIENWTVYPLVALRANGRGNFGNNFSIKIALDSERDGSSSDGRRYVLDIVETNPNGAITTIGSDFDILSFSFNPEAVAIPDSDIPDSYDVVSEDYFNKYYVPMTTSYSEDNYDAIVTALDPYCDDPKDMIDIISFKDGFGHPYDRILEDQSGDDISNTYIPLTGGTDGELDTAWLISNDPAVTTEAEALAKIEVVKEELLTKFYLGQIDENIYDARIIDAGITLDAWFPMNVKKTMVGLFTTTVRDDIFVYVDTGEEADSLQLAMAQAKSIANSISAPYGNVAINIHNGRTTDLVRNLRTTGNYEIAGSLPALYRQRRPFTVNAGYFAGKITSMVFDFYPKVVKDDLQIKPLENKNLLFAMKLDRSAASYWMSDSSQYATKFSVFGSIRNLIFSGEVMRTIKKVMIKYSFHPDDAAGAIAGADKELETVFTDPWFPTNLPIKYTIYQTRNDIINEDASVDVEIEFPGIIKRWKATIHGKRQPAAATA